MEFQQDPTALTTELAAVAERLCQSTVQVRSGRFSVGSGVIWRSDGLIITNAHVVRTRAAVELSDGRVCDATCIRRDRRQDLAALKVTAVDLPAANIANSDTLRVGELVIAVGNPHGLVGAVTTGIISRVNSTSVPQKWLMADIRLAPGNSGGPLADAQGRVIGINSMIVAGMAVAVPSNAVAHFLAQDDSRRPYLGLRLQPVFVSLNDRRVLGLLVLGVRDRSFAASSGLVTGDVLIGVAGQFFATTSDLSDALLQSRNILPLDLIRGGQRISCDVYLHGTEAA